MKFLPLALASLTLLSLTHCGISMGPSISKVSFAHGQTSSGWVPTQIIYGDLYIPITVNGHSMWGLLDSGTQRTIIPLDLAKSLGVHSFNNATVNAYGGKLRGGFGSKITVQIGAMTYVLFHPGVVPFGPIAQKFIPKNAIILGEDIFLKNAVEIKSFGQKARFSRPDSLSASMTKTDNVAKITMIHGMLTIPAAITGGPSAQLHLDTGDNGVCTLSANNTLIKHWIAAKPTRSKKQPTGIETIGLAGLYQSRSVTLSHLKLANLTFNNLPCELSNSVVNNSPVIGSIGFSLMQNFSVTFDYPSHKIYFKTELKSGSQIPGRS